MKDRPRQYNGYEIPVGKLAVYPDQGIRPLVEVYPAGRAEPFMARVYRRNKNTKQPENPSMQAREVGGEHRDMSLGAGTAVKPITVFERVVPEGIVTHIRP